jgi:hypothetical protein
MNNTKQTLESFTQQFQEYIEVNGSGQAAGYLYGTLNSLHLSDYDLELLQVLTQGMKESTAKTLTNL